ncbi:S-adenosylmethionine sensor upstream of mTORC1 [Schistocerca gregaria]|uniref:S-adenosylmethionine sensor upstream of mTORC1 n=1 Tax=Schistocerca gregaria TaxID=7010 RepID=UPI00211E9719|nr:S-adenosylmethionine sensor upstream of mTORC1 [Schistocerca gregaria]
MASPEHQELALFIKSVHHSLRRQCKKLGHEQAWKYHCNQKNILKKYASVMHTLATKFWEQSNDPLVNGSSNRIQWVVTMCMNYFLNGGRVEELIKEVKKQSYCTENTSKSSLICENSIFNVSPEKSMEKLKLLDVGSCYNPFSQFSVFQVVPIDLAPATPDVWECDFLNAKISDYGHNSLTVQQILTQGEIPANFFDVVVFSLFLEYIPCPQERYKCCQKAYTALRPEGLLFIITPDSRHATANAPIMKHWRIVLGKMGFHRIYYEKLTHLHCMAYRKSIDHNIPLKWAQKVAVKLPDSLPVEDNVLYIPQDNNSYESEESDNSNETLPQLERNDQDNALTAEIFSELPSYET